MKADPRAVYRRGLARVKRALPYVILAVVVLAVLGSGARMGAEKRSTFIYSDHLDEVAVTVDGEEMTFQDLAFYVVYEENQVQTSALAYDYEKPMNYWNSHVNGKFLSLEARNTAMDMAVHDRILLRMAQSQGVVLTTDEKSQLETRRTDFFEDLYDDQKEMLPVSAEVLNEAMQDIAVVEKYQQQLAQESGDTYASYGYDGKNYKEILKGHQVHVNTKLWNRVSMGRVTLNNEADYQPAKGDQNYFRERSSDR